MNLACNACGWVHFGLTSDEVFEEVRKFNEFYDLATEETRELYGQRASVEHYKKCVHCGGSYANFRPAVEGDCPNGCTINPILVGAT